MKPRASQRGQAIEPRLLVSFTVPGEPVPKARPRFDPRHGRTYTPPRTAEAEQRVQQYLFVAAPRLRPVDGHVRLVLHCYMAGSGRGDWDNYGKLISDACNGLVWHDDAQVTEADVKLFPFAAEARTEISVWLIAILSN